MPNACGSPDLAPISNFGAGGGVGGRVGGLAGLRLLSGSAALLRASAPRSYPNPALSRAESQPRGRPTHAKRVLDCMAHPMQKCADQQEQCRAGDRWDLRRRAPLAGGQPKSLKPSDITYIPYCVVQ